MCSSDLRDDPEFGYRLLADEARARGEMMSDRTAWKITSSNKWWSVFGKNEETRVPSRVLPFMMTDALEWMLMGRSVTNSLLVGSMSCG